MLNDPWGITVAPAEGFGALCGDLLIRQRVLLIGTLTDYTGTPIVDSGLWALTFGNGGGGGVTTSLYVAAGINNETGGLFARIDAVPEPSTWLLALGGVALLIGLRRKG